MNHPPLWLHPLFEYLALFIGVQFYRHLRKQANGGALLSGTSFWIVLACILGAAIGNKAAFWLEYPHLFLSFWRNSHLLASGQSVVGGILGGLIGVEIAKKLCGIRHSTGDDFVYPVLLGLVIGRIGCFLAGLTDGTFGIATQLPWGVDFGDGVYRHPTQIYEIIFVLALWLVLYRQQARLAAIGGLRFKWMLCAYLMWRLLVDFIKPLPFAYFGVLSGIQLLCIAGLLLYLPITLKQQRRLT